MLDLSEQRLNRTILTLAWPAILESLLQLTIYLTDSIMIGPLGSEAFAAVGQGSMLVLYITFPLWGIGTAAGAIVSRNIGRQDTVAALECGVRYFGPDRVLFGTDMPFDSEGGSVFVGETIQTIEELQASAEDKRKIYEQNIKRLLKL